MRTVPQLVARVASAMTPTRARAKIMMRNDWLLRRDLIAIRHGRDMTQADVAEKIGVTRQAVQKFERYDSDPKLSTLRRYANAVGAIVEHTVSVDVGQSVVMANAARWESTPLRKPLDAPRLQALPLVTYQHAPSAGADWSDMTRNDFRLTA